MHNDKNISSKSHSLRLGNEINMYNPTVFKTCRVYFFVWIYKEKPQLHAERSEVPPVFGIWNFGIGILILIRSCFPAMRCNLPLFKEKSRRISAPIGARASVSIGGFLQNLALLRLCGIKNGDLGEALNSAFFSENLSED